MAINYIAKGTFTSGTGALSVPMPSGYAAGDILLIMIESANQTISTPTSTSGIWTQVTNSPQYTGTAATAGGVRLAVYWKVAVTSESSVTVADSGDYTTAIVSCFRGVDTTNPIHITSGSVDSTATSSLSCPAVTTTKDYCMIVNAIGLDKDLADTDTIQSGANSNLYNFGELHDQTVASGVGGGVAFFSGVKLTAGSSGNTTATGDTSTTHAYITLALNPAGTNSATITNLLGTDGNFQVDSNADGIGDGIDSWWSTSYSMSNNIQSFTPTERYGGISSLSQTFTSGHILYACAYVKGSTSTCFKINSTTYIEAYPTGTGDFEFLSNTLSSGTSATVELLTIASSGWSQIQVKSMYLIDLTACFGAGKEPTKPEMDSWIQGKSYFSTTIYGTSVQIVTPTGIYSASALGSVTTVKGSITRSLTAILNSNAFGTPSLSTTIPSQNLSLSAISNISMIGSASILAGNFNLGLSGISNTSSVGTIGYSVGTVTVSTTSIQSSSALGNITLAKGTVGISTTGISSTSGLGNITLLPHSVTIPVGGIVSTSQLGTINIRIGVSNLSVSSIVNTSNIGTIDLVEGNVNIPLTSISNTSNIGNISFVKGNINLQLSSIVNTSSFGTPNLLQGVNVLSVAGIQNVSSVGSVTLNKGNVNLQVSGISNTQLFGIPLLSANDQFVSLTGISNIYNIGSIQCHSQYNISTSSIASSTQIGNISLIPSGVVISVLGIDNTEQFGNTSFGSGDIVLSLTSINETSVLGEILFIEGSVAINPNGINSTTVFGSIIFDCSEVQLALQGIENINSFGNTQIFNHHLYLSPTSIEPSSQIGSILLYYRIIDVIHLNGVFEDGISLSGAFQNELICQGLFEDKYNLSGSFKDIESLDGLFIPEINLKGVI